MQMCANESRSIPHFTFKLSKYPFQDLDSYNVHHNYFKITIKYIFEYENFHAI